MASLRRAIGGVTASCHGVSVRALGGGGSPFYPGLLVLTPTNKLQLVENDNPHAYVDGFQLGAYRRVSFVVRFGSASKLVVDAKNSDGGISSASGTAVSMQISVGANRMSADPSDMRILFDDVRCQAF